MIKICVYLLEESHVNRSLIIGTLVEANYKPVLDQAVKHFKSFTEEEAPLSPDLRLPCYNAAVKVLGKEGYEAVLKIYESSDLNEEKVRVGRNIYTIVGFFRKRNPSTGVFCHLSFSFGRCDASVLWELPRTPLF